MNTQISVSLSEGNSMEGASMYVAFNNITAKQYAEIKKLLEKEFGIEF